jgi:hypothetical protein
VAAEFGSSEQPVTPRVSWLRWKIVITALLYLGALQLLYLSHYKRSGIFNYRSFHFRRRQEELSPQLKIILIMTAKEREENDITRKRENNMKEQSKLSIQKPSKQVGSLTVVHVSGRSSMLLVVSSTEKTCSVAIEQVQTQFFVF